VVNYVDKRVLFGVAVVALLVVGYVGYMALNQQEPDNGEEPNGDGTPILATIAGKILDDSGNPMQGVTVKIGSFTTTTDASGAFSVEVSEGDYVVEVSKTNYSKGVKTISVTESTEYEADFTLKLISTGGGEGKVLRVITRHGADIMLVAEDMFLDSDYAKEHEIVNIEWLPIADSLWIETISRSGDVDVAWGGGPDLFDIILDSGLLAPLEGEGVEAILAGIPEDIGGSETRRIVDGEVYWAGAAISSFGFTINTQLLDFYDLPEPALVDLEIFDVTGRSVRKIIDHRPTQPGRHSFAWNGRNDRGQLVAPGIYFLELSAGSDRRIQRMVLLR